MPRPDLDAIRARADAATLGPWESEWGEVLPSDDTTHMRWLAEDSPSWEGGEGYDGSPQSWSDANFIAASREDMPALLAYIAELEAVVLPVAAHDSIVAWGSEWQSICGLCEGHAALDDARLITDDTIIHTPNCPVTLARALNIPPTRSPA